MAGGDALSNEFTCVLYVFGGGFRCPTCSLWLKGGEGSLHGPVVCLEGKWYVLLWFGKFFLVHWGANDDTVTGGLAVAQKVHVLIQLL